MKAIEIRLQRLVGTVSITDEKGKEISLMEKMRLNSGQTLSTAKESLVMLSMDQTKLITMEALSRAKINGTDKALELNVEQGDIFFNVT